MQLFTRRVATVGPPADVLAYNVGMQAFASERAGREISLWLANFGAPAGTYSYTMRVEGLADAGEVMAKLTADPEFHAKLAEGAAYRGQVDDTVANVLHGEVGDTPPPVGSVAVVTSTLIGNGAYEAAIGWGVDMAQHAAAVGGTPILFTMDATGDFGRVNWISIAADAAAVDRSFEALNADADYVSKLGQTGDLFVPGSGSRIVGTRVA